MFGNFSLDFLIFGIMPYAVLAIALFASIARYERDPFTWKTSSSQLLRRKQLVWGSILFHVGIIVLFFGHLIGLFTPIWLLDALGISYGLKQWMAVIIGGAAGLMAIANYEDRFVIPTTHREMVEDAYDLKGGCGFTDGNGCSTGSNGMSLFGGGRKFRSPQEFIKS